MAAAAMHSGHATAAKHPKHAERAPILGHRAPVTYLLATDCLATTGTPTLLRTLAEELDTDGT